MSRKHSRSYITAEATFKDELTVIDLCCGQKEVSVNNPCVKITFHFKSDVLLIFHCVGLMGTEPLPTYCLLGIFSNCHDLNEDEIWGASLNVGRERGKTFILKLS